MASSTPTPEPLPVATAHRHLLFAVGGRVYGCEVALVREIVPFRACTRLPGAPAYVCGLINLRGTVVTVLDLGLRLGAAAIDRSDGSVVLVDHGARVVGLAVDELRDVQRFDPDAVEAVDAGDARPGDGSSVGGAVRGVARAGADVVLLLDVNAIITQALL